MPSTCVDRQSDGGVFSPGVWFHFPNISSLCQVGKKKKDVARTKVSRVGETEGEREAVRRGYRLQRRRASNVGTQGVVLGTLRDTTLPVSVPCSAGRIYSSRFPKTLVLTVVQADRGGPVLPSSLVQSPGSWHAYLHITLPVLALESETQG